MMVTEKEMVVAQERYAELRREAERNSRVTRLLADAWPTGQTDGKHNWGFWRWVRRSLQPAGSPA